MGYQALLFCPDDKTARVVTQVLTELEFQVDLCNEPFAVVKKLTSQHFDAVVVDCENEQNATLTFKSARNSESNHSSLTVAVVEGQSGVAKAFRIGANLVLTKPINVEQSKGTLRVARGLLRKAGSARPAAVPEVNSQPEPSHASPTRPSPMHSSPTQPSPTQPAHSGLSHPSPPNKPAAVPAHKPAFTRLPTPPPAVPAISASLLEVEHERTPSPDPTEVALFESIPDPSAAIKAPPPGFASNHTEQSPWQPVAKSAEPVSAESAQAGRSHVSSITGHGAAAAPAKAKSRPVRSPETGSATTAEPYIDDANAELSAAAEPPLFSSIGSGSDKTSEAPGGKKLILIAAVIVVVATAGYFGWTRMHPGALTFFSSKTPALAQTQPPVAPPAALLQTNPQQLAPGTKIDQDSAAPADQDSADDASAETPASSAPEPKANRSHVAKATSVPPAATKTVAAEKTPEAIVVSNTPSRLNNPAPQPVAPVSAPSLVAVTGATNDPAISGIVSAALTNVPMPSAQALKVSQGITQGLLVHKVQPVFPMKALQAHHEGAVQLQASISNDGSVTAVKVLSGDSVLARAAVDAVKQWKYKPYLLNGLPIAIETQITVNFKLP
jgi:TonB family protein